MTSTQTHSKGLQANAPGTSQGQLPCQSNRPCEANASPPSTAPKTAQGPLPGTTTPGTAQGTFAGSRSLKLFYQSWYPASTRDADCEKPSPKGILALVHGLGEHSGRYCNVVKALTAAGYAVFAFDNQGHGKSEGQRGHIRRWQDYRDNTQAFLKLVRQQEPTAPLFLMGHSLGGLIVLDCILRNAQSTEFQDLAVCGLVVSAPPIKPTNGTASSMRIMIARLLSGLFPRLSMKMGLSECGLSRDREVADQIAKDPLIHPYVTLRWGTETLNTIAWVKNNIDQLTLPILLTHGEADPIVQPDGSREIFQRIQNPNKTLTVYPGSYHEPHNDLDAEVVVTDLVNWLNGNLESVTAAAAE